MSKTSDKKGERNKLILKVLRLIVVVVGLTGGFLYQTLEFLLLYWTFPTVVDIQQSSPFHIELPAFTFCNRIGYNFSHLCYEMDYKKTGYCGSSLFAKMANEVICKNIKSACSNGTLPKGFRLIFYAKFMEEYAVTPEDHSKLAVPLENYLNCSIEFAGNVRPCNLTNVLGSFYSEDELPQYCFTINSLWGQPEAEREKVERGSVMRFHLFLNASQRPDIPEDMNALAKEVKEEVVLPLYNPPSDPSVQLAVHSPYFLPSPYKEGMSFIGGRKYELRINLQERHLLPSPYQTNCTDYMTSWAERNGMAPINQLGVIQECRLKAIYEAHGCIPMTFDYPHSYNICRACQKEPCKFKYPEPTNDCAKLADDYNQPCDSMNYEVQKEDKVIIILKKIKSFFSNPKDGVRIALLQHDCEGTKMWRPECSTIDIEVPFDRFEITKLTYNPKFESLELFSVIGGYMGMWLGISLLAIFDLFTDAVVAIRSFLKKRRRKKQQASKPKKMTTRVRPTTYSVW